MSEIKWNLKTYKINDLTDYYKNPRQLTEKQFNQLKKSLDKFGMIDKPIVNADSRNTIIGGHQRLNVLRADKIDSVECWVPDHELDEKEVEELNIRLNKNTGEWDFNVLANEFELPDLVEWGFEPFELGVNDEPAPDDAEHQTLADKFIVPPFSVLDTRQGYWQERKRAWVALGIQSELGRGDNLHAQVSTCGRPEDLKVRYSKKKNIKGTLFKSDGVRDPGYYAKKRAVEKQIGKEISTQEFQEKYYDGYNGNEGTLSGSGTSIFDPVLCELVYRWFMPASGHVLDPFAGGSVRGITASILGHKYTGIDLSARQIEANRVQADELLTDNKPTWIVGDSKHITELAPGEYDLIFSCPPYADLEVYSDDPNDLSNMDYSDFKIVYSEIISAAVSMLKQNRFACFVVGDIRDKRGFYRNFVADTIEAFQDAGAMLYNEAVLIMAVGSLPIRATRPFQSGRKLGKAHQNVLIFYKGDPKAIKTWGDVECGDIEPEMLGS